MFRKFPKLNYDFLLNGSKTEIVDIFRSVKIDQISSDDVSPYQTYIIKNGERPDILSVNLYGDPGYHWSFFYANDSLRGGLADWPKSDDQLEKYLELTYDSYTVLGFKQTVVPNVTVSHHKQGEFTQFTNALNGYPLKSGDILHAYNDSHVEIGRGKIESFDPDTQQLWIYDIEDNFQNGTAFSIECIRSDDELSSWKNDLIQWYSTYASKLYDDIYFNQSNPQLFDPDDGTEPYYVYSPDEDAIINDLVNVKFYPEKIYLSARYAPKYFTNNDLIVTNSYLLGDTSVLSNYYTPVSYGEWEMSENSKKSFIRVIKPELIRAFSDAFEIVINA